MIAAVEADKSISAARYCGVWLKKRIFCGMVVVLRLEVLTRNAAARPRENRIRRRKEHPSATCAYGLGFALTT
jgi:hypothetical protein